MVVIIIMASLMGILSGCSRLFAGGVSDMVSSRLGRLNRETRSEREIFSETFDDIFTALDNKDKEGLKKLFAASVIKKNPNLDKQIDDLFNYYKGPKESDTLFDNGGPTSFEDNEYGTKRITLDKTFTVTAGGVTHTVFLYLRARDDFDKDGKGIHILEFATEEAISSKYFMWHYASVDIPGLYIQNSTEKRPDVARIERNNVKYTAYNRNLTVDDFLAFVSNNDDFDRLVKTIGVPNVISRNWCWFELANKQFVGCQIGEYERRGKIQVMCVSDEDRELYTLWLAKHKIKYGRVYEDYNVTEGRELSVEYFKEFIARSKRRYELQNEIGKPNVSNDGYLYYHLSDNNFVGLKGYDPDATEGIYEMFVTDDKFKTLYYIYRRQE
jgi:hypothetical protein